MLKRKDLVKNGGFSLWRGVLTLFVALIFSAAMTSMAEELLSILRLGETLTNFITVVVYTFSVLFVALVFLKFVGIKWREFFKLPNKTAIYWAPVYLGIYMVITTVALGLLMYFPKFNPDQNQDVGFSAGSGGLVLIFLALVVLTPLAEEVIFRGILYPSLKTKMNKIIAAFITSALFGLAHGQWNIGVDTFILSMIMIFALEKHKSIWLPIWLHAAKNSVAFTLVFVIKN